jgi:hypothetical protein
MLAAVLLRRPKTLFCARSGASSSQYTDLRGDTEEGRGDERGGEQRKQVWGNERGGKSEATGVLKNKP